MYEPSFPDGFRWSTHARGLVPASGVDRGPGRRAGALRPRLAFHVPVRGAPGGAALRPARRGGLPRHRPAPRRLRRAPAGRARPVRRLRRRFPRAVRDVRRRAGPSGPLPRHPVRAVHPPGTRRGGRGPLPRRVRGALARERVRAGAGHGPRRAAAGGPRTCARHRPAGRVRRGHPRGDDAPVRVSPARADLPPRAARRHRRPAPRGPGGVRGRRGPDGRLHVGRPVGVDARAPSHLDPRPRRAALRAARRARRVGRPLRPAVLAVDRRGRLAGDDRGHRCDGPGVAPGVARHRAHRRPGAHAAHRPPRAQPRLDPRARAGVRGRR